MKLMRIKLSLPDDYLRGSVLQSLGYKLVVFDSGVRSLLILSKTPRGLNHCCRLPEANAVPSFRGTLKMLAPSIYEALRCISPKSLSSTAAQKPRR